MPLPLAAAPPDAITSPTYDALVVVAPSPLERQAAALGAVAPALAAALAADATLGRATKVPAVVPAPEAPGRRLVLAPMSELTGDVDDARAVAEATYAAVARAV